MKKIILYLIFLIILGCGSEKKTIKFILDWTPNTNHTGLYVAKEKGYFKDEGIEVDILPAGQDNVIDVINGDGAEFGISFQPDLTLAYSKDKNINLLAVATILQNNTSGYLTNKIFRAKNLDGKVYGGYDTAINKAILKRIIKNDGGDGKNIKFLNSYSEDIFLSLKKGVDYADAFSGWEKIEIETRKLEKEIGFIQITDYDKNLNFYSPLIVGNKQFIKKNPEITKKFLRALKKGYEYSITNPKESSEILLKYAPSLNKDLVYKSQLFLNKNYIDKAECWGYMKDSIWNNFTKILIEEKVINKDITIQNLYTNKYLTK